MQVPCWEDGHFGHGDLLASGIKFRPAPSQRPRTRSSVDEHPISLEKARELLAGDACTRLSSSMRTTRTTRTWPPIERLIAICAGSIAESGEIVWSASA